MDNDFAYYNGHRCHNEMFNDFWKNPDVSFACKKVGKRTQQQIAPDNRSQDNSFNREYDDHQHEAEGGQQPRGKVRQRSDEGISFIKSLRLLIDMDAQWVGDVIRNRDNQESGNERGFARPDCVEAGDQGMLVTIAAVPP